MFFSVVPFARRADNLGARSDDDLMLLAAQGLTPAFEVLVRRYAGRVVHYCRKELGDPQHGEELAQEIWLSVWDHRHEYRAEGRFVVWLFTLLRNRIRNARRDRARRPVQTDDPAPVLAEAADVSPTEVDRLISGERRARLDRALEGISDQLREAVLLRFAEELSYEDIARVLDTNESTVRSRVFHGIRELRRRLKGTS